MLDHRLQILLDSHRYQKLVREAEKQRSSIAAVIREAIDRLPADPTERHSAVEAILAAEPMPVPQDPSLFRSELDAAHDRASG